jgi:radical SAM protein (TIGR01212 family)
LKQVLTFGKYLKNRFGEKVYKVPIAVTGFTCPNIDGTVTRGGCTFCENESFSPNLNKAVKIKKFSLNLNSTENPLLDKQLQEIEQQYYESREKFRTHNKATKFIFYFQAFTNTYAPLETLKVLYKKAISFDDVVGLSIGTRSDSITEETLDFISELSKNTQKEIWLEYGIQSVYNKTLDKINRGHDFENAKYWIKKTQKYKNIKICGHLIFGLPDETEEMMLESTKQTVDLGIDSVKFHPLYVVKRTALANQFYQNKFEPISEEKYIDIVVKAIKMLPDNVSVQRVSAGIENDTLISPNWCFNKQHSMKKIRQKLAENGLIY